LKHGKVTDQKSGCPPLGVTAVHEYQRLQQAILEIVILNRLDDFRLLCKILLSDSSRD